MAQLTETQRTFLDTYIRKHSILGKSKKKDSEKFLRRMGKVEEELAKLPPWHGESTLALMRNADQKANGGDFSGAYKDLKKVKLDARRKANDYDPSDDLDALDHEVVTCLQKAPPAVNAVNALRTDAAIKDAKLKDMDAFKTDLENRHKLQTVANFLDEFAQTRSRIRSRTEELERFDSVRSKAVLKQLDDGFAQLQHLPGGDGKPRSVETIRNEAIAWCAEQHSQVLAGALSKEELTQDKVTLGKTTESSPKNYREIPKFNSNEFSRGMKDEAPDKIEKLAKGKVTELLKSKGSDRDIVFDVSLKTHTELFWEFVEAHKLTNPSAIARRNKDLMSEENIKRANAYAKGITTAVNENDPNKVDFKSGDMTFESESYSNPRVLAAGAFGEVRKFDSTDGKSVVVKTALGDNKQPNLLYEVRQHQRAMEGAPTLPGRKNIIDMKGIVRDPNGQVHMVMELADAGNLNDMKKTMNKVSEKLPEEARNLMNQFIMKQALEGVMYLRDSGMVHVDLKDDNIFLMSDGTVKVADMGGSVSRPDSDKLTSLRPGDRAAGTGAYMAPESMGIVRYGGGDVSTKGDTFALGKIARLMHTGSKAPDEKQDEKLTGALAQLTNAMTESIDKRPTLESVLESSYFQNLDPNRDEDVRELTQTVIALGKKTTALENDPTNETLRDEVEELEFRLKELSDRATRPSDDLATRPGQEMGDFLRTLQSTLKEPSEFCNFVSLSTSGRFFEEMGTKLFDIKKAAECWSWNMGSAKLQPNETKLSDRLENAKAAVQKALTKVTSSELLDALKTGFQNMLTTLREQFEKAHGKGTSNTDGTWTNDVGSGSTATSSVKTESNKEGKVKLAIDQADVIDASVKKDAAGVLEIPIVPAKFNVEFSLSTDKKKAPEGTDKNAAAIVQTVLQHFKKSLNQKISALMSDVQQYQKALNSGYRGAGHEAGQLVTHANKVITDSLTGFVDEVKKGIERAGAFAASITGQPFDTKGKPIVALATDSFPEPKSFDDEYKVVSHGELAKEEVEKLLTGQPPFSWLVREEGKKFVVSSIEPEGDGTKFVHTPVEAEKVGIGVFVTYLGSRIPPEGG